ncbi:MAG: hypothetical protein KGR26_11135 [Cyanobacteria bacterium REEB65]|nr:hypothetical protein [Cyanobacteria bacterium REEB65]
MPRACGTCGHWCPIGLVPYDGAPMGQDRHGQPTILARVTAGHCGALGGIATQPQDGVECPEYTPLSNHQEPA